MPLPTSYLESILHYQSSKRKTPSTIQVGDELVTIKELCDFWVEGHKKILETTKIINDAKELMKSERKSKEEKELQAEQKVEGIQTSEECGTEGDRSDNKKETVQGSESASQKPKRRGVRKPRK